MNINHSLSPGRLTVESFAQLLISHLFCLLHFYILVSIFCLMLTGFDRSERFHSISQWKEAEMQIHPQFVFAVGVNYVTLVFG